VLQRRERIIGDRRKHLSDGLTRVAAWIESQRGLVDWIRPDAGALCCVRLNPSAFGAEGVNRLYEGMHREGVRVAPGAWFGEEPRIFRLGFGLLGMADLEAGLRGLSSALTGARKTAA
jgi:DNA-binding transcriptional MocR family regulator